MARKILTEINYDRAKIGDIVNAILTHSFGEERTPATLEAKILSDADKLDAMGALGVYRASMYSAECNRSIEDFKAHFHEKLLKLRDMMFTEEARRLASLRLRFMEQFLDQLDREIRLEA